MEVEKRSSKGGFLQLFDWNSKSRKKLFSNKSELPENSKQGKENTNGSPDLRLQQAHDYGPGSNSKQNYDYYIAPSVTENGSSRQKAPGVVARLMGLDSLPTSKARDPYFTQAFDCHSFRDSPYLNFVADFHNEHHMVVDDNMRNKLDGFRRNPVEQRLQKVQNRPIERFQSEVLPPKSAKPISVTQHRLLSPIKSPGFIPPKNAAYIMEAAAKIIEQSPRPATREKMQSSGSSSVPLRIRDLKDKMEAAQRQSRIYEASHRPKEQIAVKHIRRQPIERSQVQSEEIRPFRSPELSTRDVSQNKGKEKSVSLAVQAKSNVQKREGKTSAASKNLVNHKEQNESKSGRSRQSAQKVGERRTSLSRPSTDALRQNNQKQNSASNKDGESLKSSASYNKEKRISSTSDISRPTKTVSRIVVNTATGSRTANFVGTDAGKELSSSRESRLKSFTGKKRSVNGDICPDGNGPDNLLKCKEERSIKCNLTIEGCSNWDTADRKNGSDVVSFTFTSPIKKSNACSTSASLVPEKRNVISLFPGSYDDQSDARASTISGLNVVCADDLGMLLEQKLKELTSKVGSSCEELVKTRTASISTNSIEDSVSIISHDKGHRVDLLHEKLEDYGQASVGDLRLTATQTWQGSIKVGKQKSSFTRERDFSLQCSSPASSLEPSVSGGSCNSLDSYRSLTTDGSKYHLSDVSQEMINGKTCMRIHLVEGDTELLDSASSVSLADTIGKDSTAASTCTNFDESSLWELGYIRDIIRNADLMLEDFALANTHSILPSVLFDQLENHKTRRHKNVVEEESKIRRRVLFDAVVECLEFRCKQGSGGSFGAWAKWTTLFQRKEWLAEEVYREIAGWVSVEDLMVDEVVEKDMSTLHGKWTDFSFEAFEDGIVIEKGILSSLIDELIHDLL